MGNDVAVPCLGAYTAADNFFNTLPSQAKFKALERATEGSWTDTVSAIVEKDVALDSLSSSFYGCHYYVERAGKINITCPEER